MTRAIAMTLFAAILALAAPAQTVTLCLDGAGSDRKGEIDDAILTGALDRCFEEGLIVTTPASALGGPGDLAAVLALSRSGSVAYLLVLRPEMDGIQALPPALSWFLYEVEGGRPIDGGKVAVQAPPDSGLAPLKKMRSLGDDAAKAAIAALLLHRSLPFAAGSDSAPNGG